MTESLFLFNTKFQSYLIFLGTFAKLRKATISFVLSVYHCVCSPVWSSWAATGRIFLLNLMFEHFSKIWRENSSFIKIWQK